MGQLGNMAAYAGLSQGVDLVGESQRGLAALQNVENSVKQDRAESMMLQEMESKQYEEINAKAADMLERDRDKIRGKSLDLQSEIRSKIQEYGSRKAFFEAGGYALLNKYKSDLLTSNEVLGFQDNKANLAKIIAAKEANKGHLLSVGDINNYTNYMNGISDKITYSGLKSEVVMPTQTHDYGEVIPPADILYNDKNYMAILNNFLIDYPDKANMPKEQLDTALLAYTHNQYGRALGSNEAAANRKAMAKDRDEAYKATKAGTSEIAGNSFVTNLNHYLNATDIPVEKNIHNLMGVTNTVTGKITNYFDKVNRIKKGLDYLVGQKGNEYTEAVSSPESSSPVLLDPILGPISVGLNIGKKILGLETKYIPSSAYKVFNGQKNKMDENFFGKGEDGKYNFTVDTNEYINATGQPISAHLAEHLNNNIDDTTKVKGYFIGWTDSNGQLLTTPVDSKGKLLDKEGLSDHKKGYDQKGKFEHNLFAAVEIDGETVYRKIDIKNQNNETALRNISGENDDLTKTIKSHQAINKVEEKYKVESKQQMKDIQIENEKASTGDGVFASPVFISEAQQYTVPEQGDRNLLLKSFYQTYSALLNNGRMTASNLAKDGYVEKQEFSNMVNKYPELKDLLLNPKAITDTNLINQFADIISDDADTKGEQYQENVQLAQLWQQYYLSLARGNRK